MRSTNTLYKMALAVVGAGALALGVAQGCDEGDTIIYENNTTVQTSGNPSSLPFSGSIESSQDICDVMCSDAEQCLDPRAVYDPEHTNPGLSCMEICEEGYENLVDAVYTVAPCPSDECSEELIDVWESIFDCSGKTCGFTKDTEKDCAEAVAASESFEQKWGFDYNFM